MNNLLEALGVANTPENSIYAETALYWLKVNTYVEIDESFENVQSAVKLFVLKYIQLMSIQAGVSSESISGLSQSFTTGQSIRVQLRSLAAELFGLDALKSDVTVFSGESVWDYGC